MDPLISAGARAVPRARAGRPRRAGGRRAELVPVCHRFGPARGGRLCCVPGQESRQGGLVPAAGVDQGGGVVCCAMDQAGGRRDPVQSVQQISNQRGGSGRRAGARCATDQAGRRAWIRKKRSRQGAPCVACSCLLCCVLLRSSRPRHRSTECRRGAFHAFPGRYFVPRQRGQILHFTG